MFGQDEDDREASHADSFIKDYENFVAEVWPRLHALGFSNIELAFNTWYMSITTYIVNGMRDDDDDEDDHWKRGRA